MAITFKDLKEALADKITNKGNGWFEVYIYPGSSEIPILQVATIDENNSDGDDISVFAWYDVDDPNAFFVNPECNYYRCRMETLSRWGYRTWFTDPSTNVQSVAAVFRAYIDYMIELIYDIYENRADYIDTLEKLGFEPDKSSISKTFDNTASVMQLELNESNLIKVVLPYYEFISNSSGTIQNLFPVYRLEDGSMNNDGLGDDHEFSDIEDLKAFLLG